MKYKNGFYSLRSEKNNFDNILIRNKKVLTYLESKYKNGKEILDNLIQRNKKYKDIYNLLTLKSNNENNENKLKGKRILSEPKNNKINFNETNSNLINNKDFHLKTQEHMEQIKNLYNEIQLLQNINKKQNKYSFINLKNNNNNRNNSTKKNIFDSLNIKTSFENIDKPLKTNKSNINLISKNNTLIQLKKINFSQKNLLNSSLPKKIKKKLDENDIKIWINNEKFGLNYNNFYDEKISNKSNIMSFTRNAGSLNLKRNLSTKNYSLVQNLNDNSKEIQNPKNNI